MHTLPATLEIIANSGYLSVGIPMRVPSSLLSQAPGVTRDMPPRECGVVGSALRGPGGPGCGRRARASARRWPAVHLAPGILLATGPAFPDPADAPPTSAGPA